MIREHNRSVTLLQRAIDAIVAFIAWESAYLIRFYLLDGVGNYHRDFFLLSFPVMAITIFAFTRNHMYESYRYYAWHREFLLIIKSHIQGTATLVVFLYFVVPQRLSRLAIGLYFILVVVLALTSRGIIRQGLRSARRRGRNLSHIVVVGTGTELEDYVASLIKVPEKGIRIMYWIGSGGLAEKFGAREGTLDDVPMEGVLAPHAVIIGDTSYCIDMTTEDAIRHFNKSFINTFVVPNLQSAFIGYTIDEYHGVPMLSVNRARLTMLQAVIKRLIDILGSGLGLLILSPFFFIVGFFVKVTSKGPIFYGQERMSLDGETFRMWKFRSMKVDAEDKSGAQWATKNDDRRTAIGTFLRKTSIDEFPQLWNVLVGDMSLVGPRPERPVFIKDFKHQIPAYMLRHRMKAGITGWAQVNGWRGDTSLEKRIEYDLYYIRNWSVFLDIKILFLTLIKGFVNENAY